MAEGNDGREPTPAAPVTESGVIEEQPIASTSDVAETPVEDDPDAPLRLRLSKAIAESCFEEVEEILNTRKDAVNLRYGFLFPDDEEEATGLTPLIHAAWYNNLSILELLLTRGADVNAATTSYRSTALHIAASEKLIDNVKLLLRYNADVNLRKTSQSTVLHMAAVGGSAELCKLLLDDHAADPNVKDDTNWTPLLFAVQDGHEEMAKVLLDRGANINDRSDDSVTAIFLAAQNGYFSIVDLLLAQDADFSIARDDGVTPFDKACQNGHIDIVKLLRSKFGSIERPDADGWNAFHHACWGGQLEVVIYLLEEGMDVHKTEHNGVNALHLVSQRGYVNLAEFLLRKGLKIDEQDQDGKTAFHFACRDDQMEMVEFLLKNGAKFDSVDKFGWNALFFAAWKENDKIAQLLLGERDVHEGQEGQVNNQENSHDGISKGNSNTSPKKNQEEGENQTCQEGAQENQKREQVDEETKPQKEEQEEEKASPRGHIDRNARALDGSTVLHIAASNGSAKVFDLLISDGQVDITLRDDKNSTALSDAALQDQHQIMLQLLQTVPYFPEDPVQSDTCLATSYELPLIEVALSNFLNYSCEDSEQIKYVAFWAVANGKLELLQNCTWRKEFRVEFWSRAKATLLHVAAKFGHYEIIQELVKAEFDIATTAYRDMTPLHLAAENGHRTSVQILLDHFVGNDSENHPLDRIEQILKENKEGKSAIALVVERRHRSIEADLWKECLKFGTKNPAFQPPYSGIAGRVLELAARLERPEHENTLLHLLKQEDEPSDSATWTALHWAVFRCQDLLVWWLLSNGGHSNSKELQTALDIAKRQPDADFILELLQNPPPMLVHAADQDNDALVQLPSEKSHANLQPQGTIVDFYRTSDQINIHMKHDSVMKIVYEEGPQAIMADVRRRNDRALSKLTARLNKGKDGDTEVRKKLAPKTGGESKSAGGPGIVSAKDSSTDKKGTRVEVQAEGASDSQAKATSFTGKFEFRWLHVPINDMKLVEDLVTRTLYDARKKEKEHRSLIRFLRQSWTELAAGGMKHYMKPQLVRETLGGLVTETPAQHKPEVNPGDDADPKVQNNQFLNQSGIATPRIAVDGIKSKMSPDTAPGDRPKEKRAPQATAAQRISGPVERETIALYMPYLSLGEMPLKKYGSSSRMTRSQSSDEVSRSIAHETMTLDQYYYTALDNTEKRDGDQVLSRFLKNRSKQILVVGDLWLWVIDETTIITATTDQTYQFVDLVFENLALRKDKSKEAFERPQSVDSMMKFILGIATGAFTQNNVRIDEDESKSALGVFREAIRQVAHIESESYENFVKSVEKDAKADGNSTVQTSHYNILEETKILREIKDIRDELNILIELTEDQQNVWNEAFRSDESNDRTLNFRTPSSVRDELVEMSNEAKMVQDSIDSLLDLKQKQASIREAESGRKQAEWGREQAEATAKQSNTVMVFTVVTIIFLPLSFLVSLFALNVSDFPHQDGNVLYQGWWIFPIIFGSSAAVSIPLVWIAFDVNSLLIKYQNFRRSGTWQSWQRRQREMFKSANTSVQNLFKKVQRWSNISSSERTGLEPGLVQSVTGKEDLLRAPDSETSGRYSP